MLTDVTVRISAGLLDHADEFRVFRRLGLETRNAFFDRDFFHGRRDELPRSALRLIRLCYDSNDLESLADERPQRRGGKLRRPPEEDAHLQLSFAVMRSALFQRDTPNEARVIRFALLPL